MAVLAVFMSGVSVCGGRAGRWRYWMSRSPSKRTLIVSAGQFLGLVRRTAVDYGVDTLLVDAVIRRSAAAVTRRAVAERRTLTAS